MPERGKSSGPIQNIRRKVDRPCITMAPVEFGQIYQYLIGQVTREKLKSYKSLELEWFHYACVGVKRKPVGAWYCPNCKRKKKKEVLL